MTVGLGVGARGSEGGGQRAGVGGDVVLVVVVVRLGRALRVTAGEEVGASPGHSRFLFGAGAAHLLPGNHRDIRSAAACVCVCLCACFICSRSHIIPTLDLISPLTPVEPPCMIQ